MGEPMTGHRRMHERRDAHRRGGARRGAREVVVIDSAYLLAGRKEVQIRHDGQLYRLRLTKNGKLILNK